MRAGPAVLVTSLACLLAAAPASASLQTSTPSLHFGKQRAKTVSDVRTVTLTLVCDTPPCTMTDGDGFDPAISLTGPFRQVNDCPQRLIVNTGSPRASCTVTVRFAPVRAGGAYGILSFGASGGPVVTMDGTGTVKCTKKRKRAGKCGRGARGGDASP